MSDKNDDSQMSLFQPLKLVKQEPLPEITVYRFGDMELRCVLRGEDPWFFAVDVCKHLALEDTTSALRRLEDDEKSNLSSSAGGAGWNIVNESGLYVLVFQSKKAEAVAYRKWVTGEVLPSIRRTGQYKKGPPTEEEQLQIAETAVIGWRKAREEAQMLRLQAEIDAPKVAFADMVGDSKVLHAFRYTANKFAIPQNQFLELLEEWGLIYHQGRWHPHASAVSAELIRDIVSDAGYPQAKVTGKGLRYIAKRLDQEGLIPWPKKGGK